MIRRCIVKAVGGVVGAGGVTGAGTARAWAARSWRPLSTAAGGGGSGSGGESGSMEPGTADGFSDHDRRVDDHGVGSGEGTTHFGYQTVAAADKQGMVGDVFHRVADRYDLMNDVMSGGVHRLWKDEFVRGMLPLSRERGDEDKHVRVLDVAGGTGDIAFRIHEASKKGIAGGASVSIDLCDINASMLAVGEERAEKLGYNDGTLAFYEGNAQELPFEDNTYDVYTISFGIRNVTEIDVALREAYRVLKPGGRFMCLEFSRVDNDIIREFYDAYSFNVVPQLGAVVADDKDSYQYLVESIRNFPKQDDFVGLIGDAGFRYASYTNMTFGVVAMHSAFKL